MATALGAAPPTTTVEATLPPFPPLPWRTGVWVSVAALAWIAIGELDRLSSQVPDPLGRVFGFGDLMGAVASSEGWMALDDSLIPRTLGWWLACYLALDTVLIACYVRFGRWLRACEWVWPSRWISIIAGVDLFQNGLAAIVASLLIVGASVPPPLAYGLAWASCAKFALLGPIIASVVLQLMRRRRSSELRNKDLSLIRGLYAQVFAQRFSLLTVLPIAVLSVVPGSDILDQLPDVQRRWVETGAAASRGLAALAMLILLSVVTFVLGRLRSDYLAAKRTDLSLEQQQKLSRFRVQPSNLWLWFLPAVLLLGLAIIAWVQSPGVVQWRSLVIFAGVPTVVAALSFAIRWLRRPSSRPEAPPPDRRIQRWWLDVRHYLRSLRPPAKRSSTYGEYLSVCLVGDLAAVMILVIGGLGLVRSFVAPAALADLPDVAYQPANLLALILGAAATIVVWPIAARIMRAATLQRPPTGDELGVRSTLTPGAANLIGPRTHTMVAVFSLMLLLFVAIFPQPLAAYGGVTATTLLSIWALSMLTGSLVVLGQSRYSPEIFWLPRIRLRSAPVGSLFLAAVIITAGTQVDINVHPVRGAGLVQNDTARALAPQVEPDRALRDWLAATAGCGHNFRVQGRPVRLRAMPLVAAEGGGIRAAYWTAAGLDLMSGRAVLGADRTWHSNTRINRCRTALFSGGASGGAVGLTISRFADQTPARDQLVSLARSDALAQAVIGLFIRDIFYASTGVPLPALPRAPGWSDRAALMEHSWESAAPALGQPFLPAGGTGATTHPPGLLLLNATSVATGCRMFVSQLSLRTLGSAGAAPTSTPGTDRSAGNLTADANAPARATCDDNARPAPNSVDLLATYSTLNDGQFANGEGTASSSEAPQTGCLASLRSSTAAMLASRFPYVTPSGVIGPCGKWPRQQFVDGGYVENTGISTIIDLAPWWLERIRARNERELRTPGPIELIVPFVVYLDNGTGSDLAAPTYENTSEFLVPPLTILRSFDGQTDTAALLQQVSSLVDVDRLWNTDALPAELATAVNAELASWRPRPVIVVHQPTVPAVTAPLGWTLSDISIDTMDRSLAQQITLSCAGSSDLLCRRGYGSLRDANHLFTG